MLVSRKSISSVSTVIFRQLSLGRPGRGFSRSLRVFGVSCVSNHHESARSIFCLSSRIRGKSVIGLPPVACRWRMWFQAADGAKLFGWYAENAATSAVLLWCHSNAGNMTHRLENLRALSPGIVGIPVRLSRATEKAKGHRKGLYRDALAAYDYLTNVRRVRPERLAIIFGRSVTGRRRRR